MSGRAEWVLQKITDFHRFEASLVFIDHMKSDKKSSGNGKRLFQSPKQDSAAKQRKKVDTDAHSDS